MKSIASFYKLFMRKMLAALGLGAFWGGLEITDHLIRFAYFNGKTWQLHAVRLDEDVLEKGKIKNREQFVASLAAVKAAVPGAASKNKKIDVTVALGESAIYNQVFSLPFVEGGGFEDAVKLNMQMASPVDIGQLYSGWEISGRDQKLGRVDVLGAFSDRGLIDEMTWTLFEAGFISSAMESKALALARLFRTEGSGIDPVASYVLANVDDAGLDFLIVRAGKLYFEYGTPWRDITDAKEGITMEKFTATLGINLRQMLNFFLQHWPGAIAGTVISGSVFVDETKKVAEEVLGVPAFPLVLQTYGDVASEWFVAIGASLRNIDEKGERAEVTLLGEGAQETFEKDKVLRFVAFWRLSMPIIFAILVGMFVLTDVFLTQEKNKILSGSVNALSASQNQDVVSLRAEAANFNESVSLLASVQASQDFKYLMIQDITQLAATNNVTISQFSFAGYGSPATLTGQAQSQAQILAFQGNIQADPRFGKVTLPLTGIQSSGGSYTFSMTFPVNKVQVSSTGK